MKEWWKDYFSFTKKERTGAIVLMVLILALFIAPYFFKQEFSGPAEEELKSISKNALLAKPFHEDSLIEEGNDQNTSPENFSNKASVVPDKLFKFDPNTLSAEGWRKLGVAEKIIQTIRHYIEKGGKFRRPEDIKRIYGLKPDQAEQLVLYAEIKNSDQDNRYPGKEKAIPNAGQKEYKPYRKALVDINQADTSAWIALPGIGSKLALRIVNFREKLGGFYSVEQVSETFGLADSVFQKIKSQLFLSASGVKQIDLNKATFNELKLHPYVRWNIAQAIERYREQHGPFTTINELTEINIINEEWLKKARPYLVVN